MRAFLAAVLALGASSPIFASSTDIAFELGTVLGAEQACGMSYDQGAIGEFIEKKVNAGDMGFAGMLTTMTQGARRQVDEMSTSEKTAHCVQIRRVAKSYRFIR